MKNYSDLLQLAQIINAFGKVEQTKPIKKLQKIGEQLQSHFDKFEELKEDLRLECASTDSNGNLIVNEKGEYMFNKDGAKRLHSSMKELLNTEIEFNPIEINFPDGLENYSFLNGWVTGINFKNLENEIEL